MTSKPLLAPTPVVTPLGAAYVAEVVGGASYETLQEAIDAASVGGAVKLLENSNENITIGKGLTLDLNGKTITASSAEEPAVTVTGGAVLLQNGTITGGEGVIKSTGADLTVKNCSIQENAAKTNGGGIYASDGSLTLEGGQIADCDSTGKSGGAIYAKDCAVTATNTKISGNKAYSAAVYATGSSSLSLDGCSFIGNQSGSSSGTLHIISTGAVTLKNTTFENNVEKSAAVYLKYSGTDAALPLEISGVTVTGYTGYRYVFYVEGLVDVVADTLVLKNNATTYSVGGILYLNGAGTKALTNCTVSDNQPSQLTSVSTVALIGGGQASLINCTISGNTGGCNTSGLYVGKTVATLQGCEISGNTLAYSTGNSAAGLYVSAGAQVTATDTVIKDNTYMGSNSNSSNAGGVCVYGSSTAPASYTMNSGAVYHNRNENANCTYPSHDLYSSSAYSTVALIPAHEMTDGSFDFTNYSWVDSYSNTNNNKLTGQARRQYTAEIYSEENVQIIRADGTVEEKLYNTLYEAAAEAQAGDTLKLVAPSGKVNLGEKAVSVSKSLTLDINGKTLVTSLSSRDITVKSGASLTITGTGIMNVPLEVGARSGQYGHVTLDGNVTLTKDVNVYGQTQTPSSFTVSAFVDELSVTIYKYSSFLLEEEASVGTLTLTLGKSQNYPYEVTAKINGPVEELKLNQNVRFVNNGPIFSTAILNSKIGTLNLTHSIDSKIPGDTNPYSVTRAGAGFSADTLVYKASYLHDTEVERYTMGGNDGLLADIPFLLGADEEDVNLVRSSWEPANLNDIAEEKDLTTIQAVDGNLVLHYEKFTGNIYLNGVDGSDSNSGETASTPVKTLEEALGLLKAKNDPKSVIVVTNTAAVSGSVTVDGSTFSNPVTIRRFDDKDMKQALFTVSGTITLKNVTIDGVGVSAQEPLIDVRGGGTLNIETDAWLTGGVNTSSIRGNMTGNSRGEGGAVRVQNGTVNMSGGEISGNKAYAGGGILVYEGGQLNLSGGAITGNEATGRGTIDNPSGGGGVLIGRSGAMEMTGGQVSNNISADVGGGITVGGGMSSAYVAQDSNPTFTMTDGTISGNVSALEGGGIHIQVQGKAGISKGKITGNISNGGSAFSGGGIYVNGGRGGFENGSLELSNVWISDNTASEGGGIAGCPTASVRVYLTDGGVIWGNQDQSGSPDDIRMVSKIAGWNATGREVVYISRYMLGGGSYSWTNKADGSIATSLQLFGKESHLYSAAPTTSVDEGDCDVIITGNTGALRGGAIGTNGDVTIGRDDGSVEYGTITVKKNWNAIPEFDMLNEVYRLLYSVYFDLYCLEEGTQEWTLVDTDSSDLQVDFTPGGDVHFSWDDVHFRNLIMVDEKGNTFKYKVEERADDRYVQVGDAENSGNTYTFTNAPVYTLKIAKQVVDSYQVAQDQDFTFILALSNTQGVTAVDQAGNPVSLSFDEQGMTTFTLADGEYILLSGLAHDTTYSVMEQAHPDYEQGIKLSTWVGSSDYQTVNVNQVQGQKLTVGLNTVTFVNSTKQPHGDLSIAKQVTGIGDTTALWNFTVTLFRADGTPLPQYELAKPAYQFAYAVTNADGTQATTGTAAIAEAGGSVLFDGKTSIALTSGQSVTISGIPAGVLYEVREQEANQNDYITTVQINGADAAAADGTIQRDQVQSVAFTNFLAEDEPENPPVDPDPPVDPNPPDDDPTTIPEDDPEDDPEEIPDEDVPLEELPEEEPEDETPVTELPEEDVPLEELPEEDVPLAEVPATGDALAVWLALSGLSGSGLLALALTGRRKREDEE